MCVRGMCAASRPERAVPGVHRPLLRGGQLAPVQAQPVEPGGRQAVIVVAGHERDPPARRDLAQALEERAGELEQVGHAALAQLEHVAQQHHVVGARHGLHQPLAHGGQARHVHAAEEPEVEVGDHGARSRPGWCQSH